MATASPNGATSRRMSIASATRGTKKKPHRVLIYGPEGVGKSSFGAGAPAPVFLGAEDGTVALDVPQLQPKSWQDILDAVDSLITDDHDRQSLVIDSIDWCEPLAWARVCQDGKKSSIEDFGFGKGYVAAVDLWRGLLARLDTLRERRGMHIILIAHTVIRRFQNPEGDDYDRYTIKLHEKSGGVLKEWVEALLFATWETLTHEVDGRNKGVHTGKRVVHTERHAAWDAKNKHGLPARMDLDWSAFDSAVMRALDVGAEVERLIGQVDEATRTKARAFLGARTRLPHELIALRGRLEVRVAEMAKEQAEKAAKKEG